MKDLIGSLTVNSYQLLVESVKDYAIFMLDPKGYILTWNRGAELIKGYTAAEIIGRHFSIFYTPEQVDDGEPEKNLQRTRHLGRYEQEGWRVRKDGSVFWADVVFSSLKDDDGQLIGYAKVTRDLTSRRNAEEEISRLNRMLTHELKRSRTLLLDYQHALDVASIVAITDQKGIIHYVNDNFCVISKYSREELLGQDHRIINSKYHPPEFIRGIWTTIANGKIWRGEIRNKAKDGALYWVDTTIVPFLDEQGKPYQYLAIRTDITTRKQAEEELYRRQNVLEERVQERTLELIHAIEREKEISQMKSRFVSMASHEFRTPLSTILSSIALVDHYSHPDQLEKRAKHIARIKSCVGELTGILEDFLSVEQFDAGKVTVHLAELNVKEFIDDVIEEMAAATRAKGQRIGFSLSGLTMVKTDKKILRNVLLNLLSNAVKYTPDQQSIWVRAGVTATQLTITVQDEGIGIPVQDHKHIFEQFFRSGNVLTIRGTGLGLHIVKKYIELLGGSISFTSAENEGTTFSLSLPLDGEA